MKTLLSVALATAVVVLVCLAWMLRFSTNTAAGRFYKNDRWTWRTLIVEKSGLVHWLVAPEYKK